MRIGSQPNAVWYACFGSFVGAIVALTMQMNPESGQRLTGQVGTVNSAAPTASLRVGDKPDLDEAPIYVSTVAKPEHKRLELEVGRGDTLLGLLKSHGIGVGEAHAAIASLEGMYDPRDIRVGQTITVSKRDQADSAGLDAVRIAVGPGHDILVINSQDSAFRSETLKAETAMRPSAYAGTIDTSLYEAAITQGVPAETLVEMIRLFSYDVDFQRDIRKNDQFELMFTQSVTDDGLVVSNNDVQYASMTLRGQTFKIYAYEHADGRVDHYNEEGKGIRKALMRTPINGARLSSSFGRRKHPILGYTKMHRGVDFAAPPGTPIYAAGDGIIEKRHRWGSFGNYIRIRHGDGFSTAYAHMKSFARGHSVGSRVRQGAVIGYVGTTGRSTGPHLHYEVHKDGTQVNPMKVRFPASKSLNGEELLAFKKKRELIDYQWVEMVQAQGSAHDSSEIQRASAD